MGGFLLVRQKYSLLLPHCPAGGGLPAADVPTLADLLVLLLGNKQGTRSHALNFQASQDG